MLRPDPVMIKLVQAASGGNFTLIAHPNRAPAAIKSALLSRRYGKPGQRSARVSIKHAALIGRRRPHRSMFTYLRRVAAWRPPCSAQTLLLLSG
jgi:hypothetical protein